MKECPTCNAVASAADAFCMSCGASLAGVTSAPAAGGAVPAPAPAKPAGRKGFPTVLVLIALAACLLPAGVVLVLAASGAYVWKGSGVGTHVLTYASPRASQGELETAAAVLQKRLAQAGKKGGARVSGDQIVVSLLRHQPEEVEALDAMLRTRGALELLPVADPGGIEAEWVLDRSSGMLSPEIERATAVAGVNGAWEVDVRFSARAGTEFEALTERNVGRIVVMALDGETLCAPRVQEKISGGSARITLGSRDDPAAAEAEARRIATVLGGGTLPVELVRVKTAGEE